MFWHLLPTPVIGGQVYRLPSPQRRGVDGQDAVFRRKTATNWLHEAELDTEGKATREKILTPDPDKGRIIMCHCRCGQNRRLVQWKKE